MLHIKVRPVCPVDFVMKHNPINQAEQVELEARVAELSRSREELEESRNQFAFLYDFAPVGYFTFDRQGVIYAVNQTGERLLGVERSLLIGLSFEDFVAEKDRCVFAVFIQTVFAG